MSKSIELPGRDFKQLAAKITKFPGLGMFGGSDLVHLSCKDGWLKAASSGVVLAIGKKRCEGTMPLLAIDERVLVNFAGIVPESGTVKIGRIGEQLVMKCGRNEVTSQLINGTDYNGPELSGMTRLKFTADSAERIRFLADVAYNDATRPELCCVMLDSGGRACAMDQKAVASFRTGLKPECPVPLPLHLARAVEPGNSLYVDNKTTVLRSGFVSYSMPSLSQAVKKYPFDLIKTLQKAAGKDIGRVTGSKFAGAIDDCLKCLGQLARTEAVLCLLLLPDKLVITAENAGTKFDTRMKIFACDSQVAFNVPLVSMSRIRPFLTGDVSFAGGSQGDLYLKMKTGWAMFPGEVEPNQKGKKK